jgi:hypothetical protein
MKAGAFNSKKKKPKPAGVKKMKGREGGSIHSVKL